ncbi:Ribonuclease 3 [Aphelenchoides besseyi]|nr:Ribonuclease 3 [Aphelenchoides besseyi]
MANRQEHEPLQRQAKRQMHESKENKRAVNLKMDEPMDLDTTDDLANVENPPNKSNEMDSDLSADSDEELPSIVEPTYQTRQIMLDSYYQQLAPGHRTASLRSTEICERFKNFVINFLSARRAEQPASEPAPWIVSEAPAKKGNQEARKATDEYPAKRLKANPDNYAQLEINRKRNHPAALHSDLSFNELGQQYDGPYCKCYKEARSVGVIHNCYPGEKTIPFCNLKTNNPTSLYHYVVQIDPDFPLTNRQRSSIYHESVWYHFRGFSVFFHSEVPSNLPQRWLNRMFPEYAVRLVKAEPIEGFCVEELELFYQYVFHHLLELYDVNRGDETLGGCPLFHVMPRFVCIENFNGIEIHTLLPMAAVLSHLTNSFRPLQTSIVNSKDGRRSFRGQLLSCPFQRPACIRADNFDENSKAHVLHLTQRPTSQASRARQQLIHAQKRYRALTEKLQVRSRFTDEQLRQLEKDYGESCDEVRRLREQKHQQNEHIVKLPFKSFYTTGLNGDITQHAMFLLTIVWRVRYHWSLREFENKLEYHFKNRLLLELALTNPSNLTNYGTNSEHARNTLRNCGLRKIRDKTKAKPEQENNRRKGISTLMKIMSEHGMKSEQQSSLHHNERLEFLGDAIVELVVSNHLFFMMPYAEEGILALHRSKLVRNLNLARVGKKLGINKFLLHTHGVDLSNEDGMNRAMANAFEALMAAIYLDSEIDECDRVLSRAFFSDSPDLYNKWINLQEDPLKMNQPSDRHWIQKVKWLQKLTELEDYTGIYFHHIRLLARAFTRRQVGYNNLTLGHNQRLEFLGDTILQFFVSDYLYRHFPRHQEGHLSLLRSCLVSNRTQSVICDDLKLTDYLFDCRNGPKTNGLSMKDKADLVEAYLGAIFVDRGFGFSEVFCRVCFLPRLRLFIGSSRWNDPKSQLQQCCLSLRRRYIGGADIPVYRTVKIENPTNNRKFGVLVFFRNKRLGQGSGYTIHEAELNAAEDALIKHARLFGDFNLESTYLGKRIRAYDAEAKENPMECDEFVETKPRIENEPPSSEEDSGQLEEGELAELPEPVKISSDESSDDEN